ncbi:hypothetical protein HD806DRAFT_550966 [Xylariaceae sp. AK1471]|nr:hypothetical protein HD806DRAFT_550966 [Xylariaceae sp. AK1471]
MPLPEPWEELVSILPSWLGKGTTFKNRDTGEITPSDPRRRAFPRHAYDQPALIHTRKYITAYNASPWACTTFWGHSGRRITTGIRFRPTFYRLNFLFLAFYFAQKGYWKIGLYKVPYADEEKPMYPDTVTVEDVARRLVLLKFWSVFTQLGSWCIFHTNVFAITNMMSMLVLLFITAWKIYVPEEKKDWLKRETLMLDRVRRFE